MGFIEVMAITVNLGSITASSQPTVWALGTVRDPVVKYATPDGQTELRQSYFWSNYSTIEDVVCRVLDSVGVTCLKFTCTANQLDFFLKDFDNALNFAIALDAQLEADGGQFSSAYADILALALRQLRRCVRRDETH